MNREKLDKFLAAPAMHRGVTLEYLQKKGLAADSDTAATLRADGYRVTETMVAGDLFVMVFAKPNV